MIIVHHISIHIMQQYPSKTKLPSSPLAGSSQQLINSTGESSSHKYLSENYGYWHLITTFYLMILEGY